MGYSILVTASGGDIGQSIARILRGFKQITTIVGTDISDDNAGPYFVDEFVLVPPAADGNYVKALATIVQEKGIAAVIPASEIEIQVLDGYRQTFAVPLVMANQKAISIGSDKYETVKFLEANGISVPWTVPIDEAPRHYPCLLKNRRGSGSRNMALIENERDWQYHQARRSDAILQELLLPADAEYTCGVYRGADRITRCLVMKRVLKNDVTGMAEVVADSAIEQLCSKVAGLLDLRGSINIQLRKTESGPIIFEINPRFSSTVLFRHCAGFTDLVWSIEDALGISLIKKQSPPKYGMKIYRYYREVFKYEGKFFEF